jgi:hypothetical protein
VLFPVISVTDDLQMVQGTAETENSPRRDHAAGAPQAVAPVAAVALTGVSAWGRLVFAGRVEPLQRPVDRPEEPLLPSLLNRPPPAA